MGLGWVGLVLAGFGWFGCLVWLVWLIWFGGLDCLVGLAAWAVVWFG